MYKLKEIIDVIEQFAPLQYQESYDNSGLLVGEKDMLISSALLCLDIDENIITEAIEQGCNLIISHHPLVFSGLKRFTKNTYINRILHTAIKHDIAIYSCHTNIDSIKNGVSYKMAEKLNLKNLSALSPLEGDICKLVVNVPPEYAQRIQDSMTTYGGKIGNYDKCSFKINGTGTFRGNESSNGFIGKPTTYEEVDEVRIEVVIPRSLIAITMKEVKKIHPYEEVGYDIYTLENKNYDVGLGVVGELEEEIDTNTFISKIASDLECDIIRYSDIVKTRIKKVAICGGSGASFVGKAISSGADIYISADFKYHDFFLEKKLITIADVGHFESEKYTLEIFYDILSKNLTNFVVRCTKTGKNPINYFISK